jgi:meso-butanediol dehydrogenase/(S,S)-butanediol dehydrogenase/diacetyl reductase
MNTKTKVALTTGAGQVNVAVEHAEKELGGAPKGETYKKYVDGIALGRAETQEDVDAFVSYLAGPDSDYMTRQAPIIDGGIVYR